MLVHVDDLEADVGERFDWALREVVAVDREHSIYMTASRARRRSGRPRQYYVIAQTGAPGYNGEPDTARAFGLSAYNVDEAVAKANPRLEKWLAKGLVWNPKRYEWIMAKQAPPQLEMHILQRWREVEEFTRQHVTPALRESLRFWGMSDEEYKRRMMQVLFPYPIIYTANGANGA